MPALTDLLITARAADAALTPLPEPVNSPAFGTLAVRVAVPFFLLRVRGPRLKLFVGSNTAVMLSRKMLFAKKVPDEPSGRFPAACRLVPPPAKAQALFTEEALAELSPSTSPVFTGRLAGKM